LLPSLDSVKALAGHQHVLIPLGRPSLGEGQKELPIVNQVGSSVSKRRKGKNILNSPVHTRVIKKKKV
jgi:hypothetical protein